MGYIPQILVDRIASDEVKFVDLIVFFAMDFSIKEPMDYDSLKRSRGYNIGNDMELLWEPLAKAKNPVYRLIDLKGGLRFLSKETESRLDSENFKLAHLRLNYLEKFTNERHPVILPEVIKRLTYFDDLPYEAHHNRHLELLEELGVVFEKVKTDVGEEFLKITHPPVKTVKEKLKACPKEQRRRKIY